MDLNGVERINPRGPRRAPTISWSTTSPATDVKAGRHRTWRGCPALATGDGQPDNRDRQWHGPATTLSTLSATARRSFVNGLAAQVTINGAEAANDKAGRQRARRQRHHRRFPGCMPGQVNLTLNGGDGNDNHHRQRGQRTLSSAVAGTTWHPWAAGDDTFVWNPGDGKRHGRRAGRQRYARVQRRQTSMRKSTSRPMALG